MNAFARKNGSLHAEDVPVARIAAEVGTPCYVYSRAALRQSYGAYARGFGKTPHVVCYSVKACSNIAILRVLAKEGAGFDVVSGGELARVIRAGATRARSCSRAWARRKKKSAKRSPPGF